MAEQPTVLVVDDDEDIHHIVRAQLAAEGFTVRSALDTDSAMIALQDAPEVVLLDIRLPDGKEGLALLEDIRSLKPNLPVIMFSGRGEVTTVVEALHAGANDYFYKPDLADPQKLISIIRSHYIAPDQTPEEGGSRRQSIPGFENIIGVGSATREMINMARLVAPENINVLLMGQTGTGKELLARAIHRNSIRSNGPFISVNCAAIPEPLAESELFGHVKGAFTGAIKSRKGKFEQAHTGTLFLDEIGEQSIAMQAKILKVIEDKIVTPVGGSHSLTVDCRIISATNRNLEEEVKRRRFREDLYYRLHGFPILLPTLADRANDFPVLVEHFIRKHRPGHPCRLSPKTLKALTNFRYNGNIRQLENMIQYALIVAGKGNVLRPEHFPMLAQRRTPNKTLSLAEAERNTIDAALTATNYNLAEAARQLGIARPTLYRKLKEHKLDHRSDE